MKKLTNKEKKEKQMENRQPRIEKKKEAEKKTGKKQMKKKKPENATNFEKGRKTKRKLKGRIIQHINWR